MENVPTILNSEMLPAISIPQDVIDKIISYGKGETIYARNRAEGFLIDETLIPKVVGIIERVSREAARYIDGKVEVINDPDEDRLPEGYRLRVRIRLITMDNKMLEIKVSQWSLKYRLSRYFDFLRRKGSIQPM